jgi:hypothetical protein
VTISPSNRRPLLDSVNPLIFTTKMGLFQSKHTSSLKHEVNEYITRMIRELKECEEDLAEHEMYWFF